MAASYMSSVAGKSIIYEGDVKDYATVQGYVDSVSYAVPGAVFNMNPSAHNSFIGSSTTTVNAAYVWLEFTPRTSSTFGEVDIDTAYGASDLVTAILPYGNMVWWARCIDLSAAYYGGRKLTVGTSCNLILYTSHDANSAECVAIVDFEYATAAADRFVRVRRPS